MSRLNRACLSARCAGLGRRLLARSDRQRTVGAGGFLQAGRQAGGFVVAYNSESGLHNPGAASSRRDPFRELLTPFTADLWTEGNDS